MIRLMGAQAPMKSELPLASITSISGMAVRSSNVYAGTRLPYRISTSKSVPPAIGTTGPGALVKSEIASASYLGCRYSCHKS